MLGADMNLDEAFAGIGQLLGLDDAGVEGVQNLRDMLDLFVMLLNTDLPEIGAFEGSIPYRSVDGRDLTLDVMVPAGEGPFPVLVYLHGGAWVWGSPATHRKLTHRLAEQGFLTLSVDYRLAPEHPFPAGFNDCIHAIHFARHNAHRWAGDPERLVLAGDSAGANLAAASAIELAHSASAPAVRGVGLLYGVYDFSGLEADGITSELVDAYLSARDQIADPRVSPVLKSASLPPAHIAVGSADPLIDDAEALSAALARAGRVHDFHVYADMPHAFAQMEFLDDALPAIQRMCRFLHEVSAE
jgi:acetyl esterase